MMCRILKFSLAAMSFMSGSAVYAECKLETALRGNVEATEIKHEWDGTEYSTYLVRNADRDREGVLRQAIRYEISSQRWGYDLRLPDDSLLAAIRREKVGEGGLAYNQWVIDPYLEHERACAGRKFIIQVISSTKAGVILNGSIIGTISNFPFHEAF